MIDCHSRGTMNLTWLVEYAARAGWACIVLFPLTGLGAAESSIDCRVLGIIIVLVTLMFVASRFMDDVSQVLCIVPGRSELAWGCGLVFGLIRRFIPATRWPVSLVLCW